jgi:heat shock protein HtpX
MSLQLRMYLLVGVLFAILYGVMTALGHVIGVSNSNVYLVSAAAMLGLQYLIGPIIVGSVMRVKWVSERDEPELHRMVAELARQANVPKPKVGISQVDVPNAFAYGRFRHDGRVCVTRGLLGLLDRDELRAVLGHEICHLRNRDMVVITLLSAVPLVLSYAAQGVLHSVHAGDDDDGQGVVGTLLVAAAFMLMYLIAEFLVLYGSRIREYYADRGAVGLGNEPHYLASALYKLSASSKGGGDLDRVQSARAFFINDPAPSPKVVARLSQLVPGGRIDANWLQSLRQRPVRLSFRSTLGELFGSHPHIIKRMKALAALQS